MRRKRPRFECGLSLSRIARVSCHSLGAEWEAPGWEPAARGGPGAGRPGRSSWRAPYRIAPLPASTSTVAPSTTRYTTKIIVEWLVRNLSIHAIAA
jgi:hypothetical protein